MHTKEDVAALAEAVAATGKAVSTARTAAGNWLKATATLTGLLATVAIIKGPTDPTKLPSWGAWVIGIGMVVGLLALVRATWAMYTAAYGDPGGPQRVALSPVEGVAVRLADAREKEAKAVREQMRKGLFWSIVGVAALFVAGLVALVPPEATGGGDKTICVTVDGTEVLTVNADSLDVKESAGGVEVGACS